MWKSVAERVDEKYGGFKLGKNPYSEMILPQFCRIRFWKFLQHRL